VDCGVPGGRRRGLHFQGRQARREGADARVQDDGQARRGGQANKTIDLHIDEGPDDAKGSTSKGIYKFDGDDKFVFCFSPEGERPTKFEQVGTEQFLVELKRKDAAKK